MPRDKDTDMGGVGKEFLTTHWSMIGGSKAGKANRDQALFDLLIQRYWKPVYCYLRRKGIGNEEAKDITQGFFQEIVLGKDLIDKADQTRGRFRSLLLTALNNYLVDIYHKASAQKQIPKSKLLSMSQMEWSDFPQAVTTLTPEETFTYSWISALLERVIQDVERHYERAEKSVHWQVFYEKTLRPIMEDCEVPSLQSLCARFGIANPDAASNMIVTVKRRFQSTLRKHLRNTVTSDQEAEEEIHEIKRFLPKMSG